MKSLIAKLLGLYTYEGLHVKVIEATQKTREERREYYQKVVESLQKNGSLPPDCDLKMPKAKVVITATDGENAGKVLAKEGRWLQLPADGEKAIITYAREDNN